MAGRIVISAIPRPARQSAGRLAPPVIAARYPRAQIAQIAQIAAHPPPARSAQIAAHPPPGPIAARPDRVRLRRIPNIVSPRVLPRNNLTLRLAPS